MYLKKIAIENYGPINNFFVKLPFNGNNNPKPIIFVGKNGTGKTILLSHIIDSFYEIIGSIFKDIKIYEGLTTKFFKISGSRNLQIGREKGFAVLQYEFNSYLIEYFDKIGRLDIKDFQKYIDNFKLSPNKSDDFEKRITNFNNANKNKLENIFLNGVYFYQPAYRYEEPFWKNDDFKHNIKFKDISKFAHQLGKEIEIVNSIEENKDFLLNLVLDIYTGSEYDVNLWNNITKVLQNIKQRNDIRFGIGSRGSHRVSIVKTNEKNEAIEKIVPSIDYLSLGELVLLDLFLNIIRHSCMYNSKPLNEIEGIVVIDEVDTHLHSDLQYSVLPKLIKLFPKIQFILTTHSPLFLLGMKKFFGKDNFEIRNMPSGEQISIERFSEFENAFDYLKETEKFENEIKNEIEKINKPILYVEDEYYQIYQIAYLKLNEIIFTEENLEEIFVENAPFRIISGKSAGGVAGLLRAKSLEILENKKIVGLFDFDKEGRENFYNLGKEDFWNKEPKNNNQCETKEYNNIKYKLCYKQRKDIDHILALLLPIPERLSDLASLNWDYFTSYIEIENLLSNRFIQDNIELFEKKEVPGNLKYYKCKKNVKSNLWKRLIKSNKDEFLDFIPIFEFIKEKFGEN